MEANTVSNWILGDLIFNDKGYLNFKLDIGSQQMEGYFRVHDTNGGEDLKLVSIGNGSTPIDAEIFSSIEYSLKNYSIKNAPFEQREFITGRRILSQERFEELFKSGMKDFSNCIFEKVDIENKDLSGCSFQNSEFDGCTFAHVKGENINFNQIDFVLLPSARKGFADFSFDSAEFNGAKLRCVFEDGYISGKFENTDFSRDGFCEFRSVYFKDFAFDSCKMLSTDFIECSMSSGKINLCDMTVAKFLETEVSNTIMHDCNLFRASLQDSVFKNCDFTRADLSEVNISDTLFKNIQTHDVRNAELLITSLSDSTEENAELYKKSISEIFQIKTSEPKPLPQNNLSDQQEQNVAMDTAAVKNNDFQIKGFEMKSGIYIADFTYCGEEMQRAIWSQGGIDYVSTGNKHDTNLVRHHFTAKESRAFEAFKQSYNPEMDSSKEVSKLLEKETLNKEQASNKQQEQKLSRDIVKKINLMKKDGTPMRVCPNGQVYIDPGHILFFKRSELYQLNTYYENKYGKTFQPDSSVTVLPEKLCEKIKMMEEQGLQLIKMPGGRVGIPLLQLRFFTNEDIAILNSYHMNLAKELQPRKNEYPFSEKINQKLEILDKKSMPMKVYPNGQVLISESELKYFKTEELKEINQHYSEVAKKTFQKDPSVKDIPSSLVEKLKTMQMETGKKLSVTRAGRAILPISALGHFSDSEVSTFNSYYMNAAEKTQSLKPPIEPEP